MFLALWHRAGQRMVSPLGGRVAALVAQDGAVRIEGANAALVTWPPACLVRQGASATAYAACDCSGASVPGRPSVRLEGNVLTLAAGYLPQHPLYYAIAPDGGHVIACSQLAPLARLFPDAPLDARRLVSLIDYGSDTDTAATVYAGILRLRSCERIVAERDEIRVTREFPRIAGRYRSGKPDDLAAELRHRLDAAVDRAIGASHRISVFVSGGLDSSGVLALAAARSREAPGTTVDAISIQFAGPGDDRPYLDQVTGALGLTPVRLNPRDAGPWFVPSLSMDAQPGNLASTCLFLLAGAVAVERRSDAVLTGVGGDNVCGGLVPFARLSRLARQGHALTALHRAMRLRLPWPMGRLERLRYVFSPLVPGALRRIRRRLGRGPAYPAWLTPRSRELRARSRMEDEWHATPTPDTPDSELRYLCTRGQMADGADAVGQVSATTGCFLVDVFLDEEFVRFMVELDPLLLSHGHQYRGLYRLAMKGLLPEKLRTRQDKGFFEPAVAAAAVGSGLDTLRDLSSLEALAARGLADPTAFRPVFDACLGVLGRGERDVPMPADEHIQGLWQLLSVEAFLRDHGRGRELA